MLGQVYNVKQVCSVFYKSKMVLIQKLIPKLTKSLSFLCHFQVYPGSESGFLTTQFLITRYKVSWEGCWLSFVGSTRSVCYTTRCTISPSGYVGLLVEGAMYKALREVEKVSMSMLTFDFT